jgi:hypothetical protein
LGCRSNVLHSIIEKYWIIPTWGPDGGLASAAPWQRPAQRPAGPTKTRKSPRQCRQALANDRISNAVSYERRPSSRSSSNRRSMRCRRSFGSVHIASPTTKCWMLCTGRTTNLGISADWSSTRLRAWPAAGLICAAGRTRNRTADINKKM